MDIKIILTDFIRFCNTPTPIEIDTICHTDMSDGRVLKIDGKMVELYHFNKGYEQWWKLSKIQSAETNLSKHGLQKCLELYMQTN